jgi:hypothetical protein
MTSNATLKLIAPVPPISLPEMLKIFRQEEAQAFLGERKSISEQRRVHILDSVSPLMHYGSEIRKKDK